MGDDGSYAAWGSLCNSLQLLWEGGIWFIAGRVGDHEDDRLPFEFDCRHREDSFNLLRFLILPTSAPYSVTGPFPSDEVSRVWGNPKLEHGFLSCHTDFLHNDQPCLGFSWFLPDPQFGQVLNQFRRYIDSAAMRYLIQVNLVGFRDEGSPNRIGAPTRSEFYGDERVRMPTRMYKDGGNEIYIAEEEGLEGKFEASPSWEVRLRLSCTLAGAHDTELD